MFIFYYVEMKPSSVQNLIEVRSSVRNMIKVSFIKISTGNKGSTTIIGFVLSLVTTVLVVPTYSQDDFSFSKSNDRVD